MGDEAVSALQQASKTSEAKMSETVRHHKFLENLEERKLDLEKKKEDREQKKEDREKKKDERDAWRGKTDELDYKMKLLEKYQQLKDAYGWDDKQILAFYPDMEEVIKAKTDGS